MSEGCERCDGQGHVYDSKSGTWTRCVCIQERLREQQLGVFYSPIKLKQTNLDEILGKDAVIEAPLSALRPHMAKVLTDLFQQQKKVVVMECYRLLEIFLEKDEEFDTASQASDDCDLLIILIGFGDPKNRYLPELIVQLLGRREMLRKPTWAVLGIGLESVGMKYGVDLAVKLGDFKRVLMR